MKATEHHSPAAWPPLANGCKLKVFGVGKFLILLQALGQIGRPLTGRRHSFENTPGKTDQYGGDVVRSRYLGELSSDSLLRSAPGILKHPDIAYRQIHSTDLRFLAGVLDVAKGWSHTP